MQPIKTLNAWLDKHSNQDHFLFSSQDLRVLFPDLSDVAYKTLLSRAASSGCLKRVCRGLYVRQRNIPPTGLFLYHVAAYLRSQEFNYISLETVLSDAGVISQIPINRIFAMSSGRSNITSCETFGSIEFVHTNQTPNGLKEKIFYDGRCGMWRATVALALRDMRATHRSCDLIDWEAANEFV